MKKTTDKELCEIEFNSQGLFCSVVNVWLSKEKEKMSSPSTPITHLHQTLQSIMLLKPNTRQGFIMSRISWITGLSAQVSSHLNDHLPQWNVTQIWGDNGSRLSTASCHFNQGNLSRRRHTGATCGTERCCRHGNTATRQPANPSRSLFLPLSLPCSPTFSPHTPALFITSSHWGHRPNSTWAHRTVCPHSQWERDDMLKAFN